jgi:hypothetical protein
MGEPPLSAKAGGVQEIVISVPLAETFVSVVGGEGSDAAMKVPTSDSTESPMVFVALTLNW